MSKNIKLREYLIDCIDNSGYSDVELKTKYEKLAFLATTFYAEYYQPQKRNVGLGRAIGQWLAGLPSMCTVEFRNHEIIKLGKKLGLLPTAPCELYESHFLDQWFELCGQEIHQMLLEQYSELDLLQPDMLPPTSKTA